MREIKFRAFYAPGIADKEMLGKTVYGEKYPYSGAALSIWESDLIALGPNSVHIMQYTGLKDKNGKEIYEGDIVSEGKYTAYNVEGTYSRKHEIVFWKGQFGYHDETPGDRNHIFRIAGKCCEVIGNIYENSELLDKP